MTRDITPIKWIIGAIALLIIIAGACVLWYRYDTASDRKAAADALKLLRQQEATQKADTESEVEQAADVSVEGSTLTTEKPINEMTAEVENSTEAETQQPSEMSAKEAAAKDVPVSPHGFGPYPEIPADYSGTAAWHLYTDPEDELLVRVRIKLWQQGIKAEGVTYKRNGLIYPIIKGVRYVEWDTKEYPDGSSERYVSRSTGHPDDSFRREDGRPVFESDIPGHLTIYTYPDGGIDPYQFLDLPKE